MAGRLIGDAYIVIYPQTDQFGPQAAAGIKKQLAALKPIVTVYPSLNKGATAALESELEAVKPVVNVGANLDAASAAKVKAQLDSLAGRMSIGAYLDPASMAKVGAELQAAQNEEMLRVGISPAQLAATKAGIEALLKDVDLGFRPDPASLAALKKGIDAALNPVEEHFLLDPADLAAAKASVNQFLSSSALLNVRINPATLAAVKAQTDAFKAAQAAVPIDIPVQANITPAKTRLDELSANVSVLSTRLVNLRASVNDTGAEAKVAALQVQATALARALAAAGSGDDWAPLEAKLLSITAGMDKIVAAEKAVEAETAKATGVFQALGLQGPGSLIHITDILNASLPEVKLFGGAISAMYTALMGGDKELPTIASHLLAVGTSAHLTAEAGIEIVAIWAPALIALTAFTVAAGPAVDTIYKQLVNMNTAATGTGQAFKSLAMTGESVTAAVKPTVMEAFGIALYAAQQRSGTLSTAMHTLGSDIDQMAARAAVAFDSSSGGKLFTTGTADANGLMQAFASLGSILGTLMKAVPGYAEVFLQFGNDLLTVAAKSASFAEPIIAEALKLHGALLYGGLVGTAAAWVFPKIVAATTTVVEAFAAMATAVLGSESLIVEGSGTMLLGLDALSGAPVLAIGLVVGALAGLYLYMKTTSNEAQAFNKTLQGALSNTAIGQLSAQIKTDLVSTTTQYVQAQQQLTVATKTATDAQTAEVAAGRGGEAQYLSNAQAVSRAQANVATYSQGLQQLTTDQTHVNTNLAEIAKNFGLQGSASSQAAQALTLANGAQVSSNQLMATGAANTATLNAQIHGYVTELSVMTAGTGTLNEALNALNVTQSAQVSDAQKLAQAYSSYIGIVTGGDSAFTTFEQGQATLADTLGGKVTPALVTSTTASTKAGTSLTKLASGGTDATRSLATTTSATTSAAAAADTLSVKVGNITEKFSLAGAAMNGTSTAALAVRQAFDQQVSAATTLYGNLQVMAAVSGNTATAQSALARAGKDLVAQLLPMAAGSQEATAEVSALAQIVGGPSTDSFQALAKWVGNTKGAEADLNTQQTILTLSSANLTAAAKDLSAAVGSEVTAAEASAIAQTEGLSAKTLALAQAFSQSQGQASASVTTLAGQYYEALIKAGTGATTAQSDVDAFLGELGATGGVVSQVNAALAKLPKTVSISVNIAVNAIENAVAAGIPATTATQVANSLAGAGLELGGLVHAAGGMTVRGSGPSGKDSQLIMAAPGELVIPTSHAPAFRDQARKASIPGFAGGGMPEPVFGYGSLAGMSYSFGANGPEYTGAASPATAANPGLPGITTYQANSLISLMQQQNKLLAQMPYAYAQALSQANAAGVRRGYFATAG